VLQGRDFRDVTFNTVQVAAVPVALAQLPAPVTAFSGRDAELEQVTGLLSPGAAAAAVVVSAVAGLAGVGKTALAIQAAYAAREAGWFAGGVLFLDLHGYDDKAVQPGQALDALLRALGVPAEHIPPGTEERAGLYRSALAGISDPVLVIADNASAEAQVRPLLPGAGPHRVLVTSRHTLAGLGARLLDVTVLADQAAIELVEGVLRVARPDDDRIASDPEAARRLAEACGGLPLALRITAALLAADPSLTAAELAGQLRDEIGRLQALRYDDGGGTSAPSVAAAFDLSYRHLDDSAARLFRLLPVNPGPDVSTAAAAALAGEPVGQARTVLGRLVRAHLVESAGGTGRWRMHDLLRLYASQLSGAGAELREREQAWDRLLDYYLISAHAADGHMRALSGMSAPEQFTGRKQALAWLDAERPSLIAAVTMAASTGLDEVAMRLPLMLGEYLDWRRRFDDKIAILGISRKVARRLGNQQLEAAALTGAGLALYQVRRPEEAIAALQDAVAISRKIKDRHAEGTALNNLGLALHEAGQFEEAITAWQDAAAIFREAGDRHGEGMALGNLGLALQEAGQFEEVLTTHRDAAAIFREAGDRHGEGIALGNLGVALHEVGQFEEAITSTRGAVAIFREAGDRHREGMALCNLGAPLRELERFDEAITTSQEALAIFQETRDRYGEGMALDNLGLALRAAGRSEEAISAHRDAAAIFRAGGDQRREGIALDNMKSVPASTS